MTAETNLHNFDSVSEICSVSARLLESITGDQSYGLESIGKPTFV